MGGAVYELIAAASRLRDGSQSIASRMVSEGVADLVYNPLNYAWDVHEEFIRRTGGNGAKCILLGMNPGPHGMGQMGIPFAATSVVRDLIGITGISVAKPEVIHSRRPVNGLEHTKEEVSGTRLWGLLQHRYGTIDKISNEIYVVTHCPLMILNGVRGPNVTPNNISGKSVEELMDICDQHLREVVKALDATKVVGIGKYAEKRAVSALCGLGVSVETCWHPSPASPLANRNGGADWRANISKVLP